MQQHGWTLKALCFHLYVESKKNQTHRNRTVWWLSEAGDGVGEMGEGEQKVQTPDYKIYKSWGCNG